MNLRLPTLLALSLLAAACGNKKDDSAAPAHSGSADATAAAGVDPKIDAMAKAVLPCKAWDTSFDSSCPAMKAWSDAKDDFNEGKADASLVAMLGSSDEHIRYLAAYKLNQYGKAFAKDKALAAAIVAAAEKEKSKFCAREIGSVVGRIDVKETGTFDRIKVMVGKHAVNDMRYGIIGNLLFNNQEHEGVYNLIRDTVKDPDKQVAQQALSAFWVGGGKKMDATCQLYVEHLENANDDLSASAHNYLSWYRRCTNKYDTLLDSLEKKTKGGAVTNSSYVTAATHICEDEKATEKQRKRAAEIARQVANKKDNKGFARPNALEAVMKCDTSNGGRSFVGKFKKDSDKYTADKANELLNKQK